MLRHDALPEKRPGVDEAGVHELPDVLAAGRATVGLPWLLGLEAMTSGALLLAGAAAEIKRVGTATGATSG